MLQGLGRFLSKPSITITTTLMNPGTPLLNSIWRSTALLGATVVASAAFAGTGAAAPLALPVPPIAGDNGTVKVHRTTTSADDPRNEPHVCAFYLVGFNFDAGQQVTWRIVGWAPTGDRTTVASTGMLVLDANGHGRTADMSLPDGHYKLVWNFVGENGSAKHKVFWVRCHTPPVNPPPTSPNPTSTPTPTVSATTSTAPSPSPSQTPSEGAGQPGNSTSPPPAHVAQPVKSSSGLPFTGFAGRLLAALGAALVLGGAGAIFIANRRRGRHASTSS
jgi:hypothetical protein